MKKKQIETLKGLLEEWRKVSKNREMRRDWESQILAYLTGCLDGLSPEIIKEQKDVK